MMLNIYDIIKKQKYNFIIFLLVIFNLFFPKGGIKISDIPITIGMILLIMVLFYQVFNNLYHKRLLTISKDRFFILASWLPFQLILLMCFSFNGTNSLGVFLSMVFNFIFLPWMFIFVEGNHFDILNKNFLFKLIRFGIIFVAIFGIINFMMRNTIEIPFLTVNYMDLGEINDKNIKRGEDLYKLISTYQNGNIYGVSMLLLLPLFCFLEKRTWLQVIVKISILLTLSRTAWIGLLLYEFLKIIFIKFSAKKLISFLLMVSGIVIVISMLLSLMEVDINFIFDENLGSRRGALEQIDMSIIVGSTAIGWYSDIVYANIMLNFGLLGLISFIFAVLSPILIYMKNKKVDLVKKNLVLGYIIYLIISCSDGAILLLPVMIFFWFIVLSITSKNLTNINLK